MTKQFQQRKIIPTRTKASVFSLLYAAILSQLVDTQVTRVGAIILHYHLHNNNNL